MEVLNIFNEEQLKVLEKNDFLIPLIKNELVKNNIKDIALDEEEISKIKYEFMQANKIKNDSEFSKWLIDNNTTEDEVLKDISTQSKIQAYCKEQFTHRAHAHFLSRKTDLDQVVYSLIRTKDPYQVNELFLRIQGGEATFSEIARNYSQGPEQQTLGVVGPLPLTQGHPKIVEICRSSKQGEIIEPFQLGEWWIIVRLEYLIEAVLDKNMEITMINELYHNWLNEESKTILKELKLSS